MDIKELIKKYLPEAKVMQLATVDGDQPWICTVHFAFDDELNLYWMSSRRSRHSREVAGSKRVAVAIPIKFPERPVIGIQLEGEAEALQGEELEEGLNVYGDRFDMKEEAKKGFLLAKDPEAALYQFTPRLFVLFDAVNFPDNPRQEWKLGNS